jgi:hypothetical protein
MKDTARRQEHDAEDNAGSPSSAAPRRIRQSLQEVDGARQEVDGNRAESGGSSRKPAAALRFGQRRKKVGGAARQLTAAHRKLTTRHRRQRRPKDLDGGAVGTTASPGN